MLQYLLWVFYNLLIPITHAWMITSVLILAGWLITRTLMLYQARFTELRQEQLDYAYRACVALIAWVVYGMPITVVGMALIPPVLMLSVLMWILRLSDRYNPHRHFLVIYNKIITAVCFHNTMGVTTTVTLKLIDDRPVQPDEVRIVFSSHPSNTELLPYMWLLPSQLGPDLVFVGASRHRYHPIGIAWWFLQLIWMIPRSKGDVALKIIQRKMTKLLASRRRNVIVGSFVQGTRSTWQKWQDSLVAVQAKVDRWRAEGRTEMADRLQLIVDTAQAVIPRPSGPYLMHQTAPDNARYFIVGVRSPVHFGKGFNLMPNMVDGTIEVRIREVPRPVEGKNKFFLWLCEQIGAEDNWANQVDPIEDHAPMIRPAAHNTAG